MKLKKTPILIFIPLFILSCQIQEMNGINVRVSMETEPVAHSGDAADDICIWINKQFPDKNRVIGTDKKGGLVVYNQAGRIVQYLVLGNINNVDLRYNIDYQGARTDLIAASDRTNDDIIILFLDPLSGLINTSRLFRIHCGIKVYGFCLYKNLENKKLYAFVNSGNGEVEQWDLDFTDGFLLVRTFSVGSITEGCVADDELKYFYIAEEDVGIWRYGANPSDGNSRIVVDSISTNSDLHSDLEGLTIYYASGGGGYLLASIQGNSTYAIWSRRTGEYLGSFSVLGDKTLDGVSHTDGIDVCNMPFSDIFSNGIFVVQDNINTGPLANQNFKMISWQDLSIAFNCELKIEPKYNIIR